MEENEIEIDEEQFSHDLHVLIDYFVDDEFETLNKVLSGSRMPGMYGLSSEPPKKQEEEFDPKFLDEI